MNLNPKKKDKVLNPYAGMELIDGTIVSDYGVIVGKKKDRYYCDFGVDDHATEELHREDLIEITKGIWKDTHEV